MPRRGMASLTSMHINDDQRCQCKNRDPKACNLDKEARMSEYSRLVKMHSSVVVFLMNMPPGQATFILTFHILWTWHQ